MNFSKKEFVQVSEITVAEIGNEVDFAREMRNFRQCDMNGDEQLSLEEFKGFLYPQYYDHTYSIHIDNNVKIFDTDKDGVISKVEYIAEIRRLFVPVRCRMINWPWFSELIPIWTLILKWRHFWHLTRM